MAIFKGLYRNKGIYWHGADGYGDETNVVAKTMAECKKIIDKQIEDEISRIEARKSDADRYFESFTIEERRKMRILANKDPGFWDTGLTLAEYWFSKK